MSDEDREKGGREAKEKWPEKSKKYGERLALGSADRTYTPPASTDGMVKMPASTAVTVELMESLTSATKRFGDPVWVRVSADVAVDGTLVVRKGAMVKALVRDAKGKGGFGKAGVVDVGSFSMSAIDGTACPVIGQVTLRGKTEGTGWQSCFGGAVGSYLVKGGQGYVPAGSSVMASAKTDVWIGPVASEPASPSSAHPTVAPVEASAGCSRIGSVFPAGKGPDGTSTTFMKGRRHETPFRARIRSHLCPDVGHGRSGGSPRQGAA
jgi:hypothetical protein